MFSLDFKPQFLNYPLDTHEYTRVSHRWKEVAAETSRLQAEIGGLLQQYEYASFDVDSRDKYAQYIRRLREKVAVLEEEQRECQQVVDLHINLNLEEKIRRKSRPQITNNILDQYKQAIAAKKLRKIAEKMKQVEIQRSLLDEATSKQTEGLVQGHLGSGSQMFKSRKMQLNPEKKTIFGNIHNPGIKLLRFKESQSQQHSNQAENMRKSTVERRMKLPAIGKQEISQSSLLVQSSPIRFNPFSKMQSQFPKKSHS